MEARWGSVQCVPTAVTKVQMGFSLRGDLALAAATFGCVFGLGDVFPGCKAPLPPPPRGFFVLEKQDPAAEARVSLGMGSGACILRKRPLFRQRPAEQRG